MFKKLLTMLAIVGTLISGTSAYALGVSPAPSGNPIDEYVANLTATPSTFAPETGATTTLSFDVLKAAYVYFYVMDSNYNIVTTLSSYVSQQPQRLSYTWYGKSGNTAAGTAFAAGDYTAKVVMTSDNTGTIIYGSKTTTVTIGPSTERPVVSNLKATPSTFSAKSGGDTAFMTFNVSKDAYLTLTVKDGSTAIKTFSDYDGNDWYRSVYNHSVAWDGRKDDGTYVADGTYTISLTAQNTYGQDTKTASVTASATGPVTSGYIKNFSIDPTTWDPTHEELEIKFELTTTVRSLMIEATSGNKVVEIMDDENVDDDKYTESWDGTDDDGDYVDQGTWKITVRADGTTVTKNVTVAYKKPEITSAFVTKTSFDPSIGESTNLVFNLSAAANLTIDIYQNNVRQFKLVDGLEVKKNRWYAVNWNGIDDEGDYVTEGNDWEFRILVENKTDDDVSSNAKVGVTVGKDEVSDKKANVTNDSTLPIVFDDADFTTMDFEYCLDEDAEVYLAIYKGTSTSGTTEAELLDYVDQEVGCHTVNWDGRDENNKMLKDGAYSYKLISKAGSYKDTETGRFIVGNAGYLYEEPVYDDDDNGTTPPTPDDDQYLPQGTAAEYYSDLAYATEGSELSNAIAWVTEKGIFQGYSDRTFKPYQPINRAEVLKVVLRAFGTSLLSTSGTNEGFRDVDSYAWYMPYVKTAKYYGMLTGYGDGTVRLTNDVNRVELLKFVLQASNAFTGYEFTTGYYNPNYADVDPSSWFYDYANTAFSYGLYDAYTIGGQQYLKPAQMVERGEVAVLLYRMAKAGLLY